MKKKFLKSNRKFLEIMRDRIDKVDGRRKKHYSARVQMEKLLAIFLNREKSFNTVESRERLSGKKVISNTLAYFLKKR